MTMSDYQEIEDMTLEQAEDAILRGVHHWHMICQRYSPNYLRLMTRSEKAAAAMELLGLIDALNSICDRIEELYDARLNTEQ